MGYAFGAGGAVSELLLAALAAAAGPMAPATVEGGVQAQTVAASEPFCAPGGGNAMTALLPAAPASPVAAGTPVGTRHAAFVDLSPRSVSSDGAVRRAADGLFYVNAMVNGVPVRFLIDTGASIVVLTAADAERVGVMPPAESFRHEAETAGGRTAMARVTLAKLAAGPAERQGIDAAIADSGLGVSLLGQNWLSKLDSITISGDEMVMR